MPPPVAQVIVPQIFGYPSPRIEYVTYQVTTFDATVTNVALFDILTDQSVLFEYLAMARQIGGGAGTVGHSLAQQIFSTYRNIGGTLTRISETALFSHRDDGTWTASSSVVGGRVAVRVQGAASKIVDWEVAIRWAHTVKK